MYFSSDRRLVLNLYLYIRRGEEKTLSYCSLCLQEKTLCVDYNIVCDDENIVQIRYATDVEKDVLIEALKDDGTDAAKDYLKRFFNIEQEHKFKPFDKVLVRDDGDERWRISLFSSCSNNQKYRFCCLTRFKQCVRYEGNEKLLGTTDEPKH